MFTVTEFESVFQAIPDKSGTIPENLLRPFPFIFLSDDCNTNMVALHKHPNLSLEEYVSVVFPRLHARVGNRYFCSGKNREFILDSQLEAIPPSLLMKFNLV